MWSGWLPNFSAPHPTSYRSISLLVVIFRKLYTWSTILSSQFLDVTEAISIKWAHNGDTGAFLLRHMYISYFSQNFFQDQASTQCLTELQAPLSFKYNVPLFSLGLHCILTQLYFPQLWILDKRFLLSWLVALHEWWDCLFYYTCNFIVGKLKAFSEIRTVTNFLKIDKERSPSYNSILEFSLWLDYQPLQENSSNTEPPRWLCLSQQLPLLHSYYMFIDCWAKWINSGLLFLLNNESVVV